MHMHTVSDKKLGGAWTAVGLVSCSYSSVLRLSKTGDGNSLGTGYRTGEINVGYM